MYRNEVLARKEMLAKAILEKEEREKRSEFLQENAQYIKILERSQFLLRSHRMPTHHQPQEVIEQCLFVYDCITFLRYTYLHKGTYIHIYN